MEHKRIYLSGPITGNDDYINDFHIAEEIAATRFPDATIVNPAQMDGILIRHSDEVEHSEYMRFDMALLAQCDTIMMLPGFEESEGAKAELASAIYNGKSILYLGINYGITEG